MNPGFMKKKGSVVFDGNVTRDESENNSKIPNMNYLRELVDIEKSDGQLSEGDPFNSGVSRDTRRQTDTQLELIQPSIVMGMSTILGDKHNLNEDRAMLSCFQVAEDVYNVAAVFDGHGGHYCADYISKTLSKDMKSFFQDPSSWENGENVMIEAFRDIDKRFCEKAIKQKDYSGACATIVVNNDDELIIGNIGDCRAIMVPIGDNGAYQAPVELTVDHRADSTAENMRIYAAGGKVEQGRIMSLQPSRSFGDIDVKLATGKDVVIASPDVDKIFIRKNTNQKRADNKPFLIIATDGVWDVLDNKQAANVVKNTLKVQNPSKSKSFKFLRSKSKTSVNSVSNIAEACAEALVQKALASGSDDDITAAVLIF